MRFGSFRILVTDVKFCSAIGTVVSAHAAAIVSSDASLTGGATCRSTCLTVPALGAFEGSPVASNDVS